MKSNDTMGIVKGTAVGMITGIAVGMAGHLILSQNKRSLKKRADKAVNRVEEALESAHHMMFK